MPIARKYQISLTETPYNIGISRYFYFFIDTY